MEDRKPQHDLTAPETPVAAQCDDFEPPNGPQSSDPPPPDGGGPFTVEGD